MNIRFLQLKSIKPKNQKGFTLLEILVAVSLMGVLFVMMNTSMGDLTFARNSVMQSSKHWHTLEVTYAHLFQDLNSAFLADTSFLGKIDPLESEFVGTSQSLSFSTLSGVHTIEDHHDSEQHNVGYSLKESENDSLLMRRSTDFLTQDVEKGGLNFVLMSQIKTLNFEYYDPVKKEWKTEWDTRSVDFAGRLPQTVRVTVVSYSEPKTEDDDAEERREITTVWMMPIAMYAKKIKF